jgi:hypothetical protein
LDRTALAASMSKYELLRDHLREQALGEVVLTFSEIESLIGGPLPASAERPQWWSNRTNPRTNHVQREAWRGAGYNACLDQGSRKVRFQKDR